MAIFMATHIHMLTLAYRSHNSAAVLLVKIHWKDPSTLQTAVTRVVM